MTPLWMVLFLIAADPGQYGQAAQDSSSVATAPPVSSGSACTGRALSEATQAALRRWARPGGAELEQAAREFVILYRELDEDASLGIATRQQLRRKVRARLAKLAGQLVRRVAKENRDNKAKQPATLALPPDRQERLAQMAAPGGQAGGVGFAGAGSQRGAAPRNFGPPDSSQDLIDLIQRTIAPSTWDVNGGKGAIRYWRPGMALIISQTTEVHEDIADLLEQLERSSR